MIEPRFCPYCGHQHPKGLPSTGYNGTGETFHRCEKCKTEFRLAEGTDRD